jgi:hypothetical protein
MNELKFSESEIPYEELANFGLSQEMIDDFPESIMNKFLSGQRTPLLPIERADFDGVVHKDFARIRLQQTEDQFAINRCEDDRSLKSKRGRQCVRNWVW